MKYSIYVIKSVKLYYVIVQKTRLKYIFCLENNVMVDLVRIMMHPDNHTISIKAEEKAKVVASVLG